MAQTTKKTVAINTLKFGMILSNTLWGIHLISV